MDRVPILSLGDVLLVSIQIDLQDESVLALQEDLAERIVATIASLSKVLDAETVVVGMRPAVAITLVELGLSLQGVRTALDLERGLAALRQRRAERAIPIVDEADAPAEIAASGGD